MRPCRPKHTNRPHGARERDTMNAETITIEAGHRVRLAGQSYELVENADAQAILAPAVNVQTNRHLKVTCQNPACAEGRAKLGRRGPYTLRGSRDTFRDGLPVCGACGGTNADGSSTTMQPDGWSLADLDAAPDAPPES